MTKWQKRGKTIKKALVAVFSLISGAVNGMFGGGGGMLVVPTLTNLEQIDVKRGHATAIAVILPVTLVTATIYSFRLPTDAKLAFISSIAVTIGGVVGSFCLKKINGTLISIMFYLLLIVAGIRMVI